MAFLWPRSEDSRFGYISASPSRKFCEAFPRRVAILGSTGSIGRNALAVLSDYPESFKIMGLACARNVSLLARQAILYRPELLCVLDDKAREELSALLPPDYSPTVLAGPEAYACLAALENLDLVLSAQSGAAGLVGTLAAALAGHVVALANKESLVLAGSLLRQICSQTGASILPVDSEHFALFECLGGRAEFAEELVLTASGGPFRLYEQAELEKVQPEQALAHPSWSMGAKITIDSATLMNKGLEIIEAMHLFGVNARRIKVLVHPQSLVHSLVRFRDNALLAQLAVPDMRLPLAACLLWPKMPVAPVGPLNLAAIGELSFHEPDLVKFPALALAIRVAETENSLAGAGPCNMCVVMNAANEAAVGEFLAGHLNFCQIPRLVNEALDALARESRRLPVARYAGLAPEKAALEIWQSILSLDGLAREYVHKATSD